MRVTIVGVDGLDATLIAEWAADLPALAGLLREGSGEVRSTFPPDSIPAWASIFMGVTPAEHGVMGHVEYLSTRSDSGPKSGFGDGLRGRTFWDEASRRGMRVCVVNPFIAFPPWEVNGLMVSGPIGEGDPMSVPDGRVSNAGGPIIGGIPDFPSRRALADFVQRTRADIDALTEYSGRLFSEEDYQLRFVSYFQLDRVQHFFWRHMDAQDPTHPRNGRHQGVIKQFYLQFEQIVAGLLERMTPADALIVLSDHGQRRRCERVFNLNEFLRAEGLLVPDVRGPKYLDRRYLLERGKSFALRAVYRLAVEEQAYKLAGKLPNRKSLRTSAHVIARGTSVAWASDIGGTNPFGGVVIDRAALGSHGLDYDRVVSAVCDGLTAASVDCGIRPVLWAAPRDAVYHGERITDFPDVLFEMLPEYGVGFSLYDGLSGPNTMHRRISGGHRRAAFFGVHAPSGDLSIPAAVEDVAGYVLALLGDPMRFQCGE